MSGHPGRPTPPCRPGKNKLVGAARQVDVHVAWGLCPRDSALDFSGAGIHCQIDLGARDAPTHHGFDIAVVWHSVSELCATRRHTSAHVSG